LIAQVISELDEKKREALEKTWVRVNQDFGSIFSTLLPGTTAKLDPQEGQSFLNGPPPPTIPVSKFAQRRDLASSLALSKIGGLKGTFHLPMQTHASGRGSEGIC